jgi:hypothetical protein
MTTSRVRLTAELVKDIANFIRAGGFPDVAAEALGISVEGFRAWVHQGSGRRRNDRRRVLAESLRKAAAQARLKAEVELFANDPLKWLMHGPGKETPTRHGWSLAPHAGCQLGPGETNLDVLESWQFAQQVYDILKRYPEAQADVLNLCRASAVPVDAGSP